MYEGKSFTEVLFSDIGKKIKMIAKIAFWIGVTFSIIFSICMFASAAEYSYDGGILTVYGFIFLLLGPVASWMNSIITYGFGELLDNVSNIKKTVVPDNTPSSEIKVTYKCPKCGEAVSKGDTECKCGQKLAWKE